MKNGFKLGLSCSAMVLGIVAIVAAKNAHSNKWDAKARIAEANAEAAKEENKKSKKVKEVEEIK